MHYETRLEIGLPPERLAALLTDPGRQPDWTRGLKRVEPMEGHPGTEGATARLIYHQGRRAVVVEERIEQSDLPRGFTASYTAGRYRWRERHVFEALPGHRTLWTMRTEVKGRGLAGWMARAAPGLLRRRQQRWMRDVRRVAGEA